MFLNFSHGECLLMLKVVLNLRNPMHLGLSATLDVFPSCVQSPVVADLALLATTTYNHCWDLSPYKSQYCRYTWLF